MFIILYIGQTEITCGVDDGDILHTGKEITTLALSLCSCCYGYLAYV